MHIVCVYTQKCFHVDGRSVSLQHWWKLYSSVNSLRVGSPAAAACRALWNCACWTQTWRFSVFCSRQSVFWCAHHHSGVPRLSLKAPTSHKGPESNNFTQTTHLHTGSHLLFKNPWQNILFSRIFTHLRFFCFVLFCFFDAGCCCVCVTDDSQSCCLTGSGCEGTQ